MKKELKKSAAIATEKLNRFRRLRSMKDDELHPNLTEDVFAFTFPMYKKGDYHHNLSLLQRDLASDGILSDDLIKRALLVLMSGFKGRGYYHEECDGFLQQLFAMVDLDHILSNDEAFFSGYLESLYQLGDYEENKSRFLQRDLRVAQAVNGAVVVGEVKGRAHEARFHLDSVNLFRDE